MKLNALSRFAGMARFGSMLACTLLLWSGGLPSAVAQVTTSGLTGRIVDENGVALAGADVVVTHEPTGTRYTAVSRSNGSFSLRSLRPGGPYTVSAESPGHVRGFQRNLFLDLGQDAQVALVLQGDEVIELEAFEVVGTATDRLFNSDRMGGGSQLGSEDVASIPIGDRSLNSLLRLDPRINYNRDPSDRSFSAGGASNRYNSILIDGVSASDPFGLNSNNTAAERNVIPLDSVEAVTIATSPFDPRRGGFTGAQVNAVTKSGGNEFSGSVYYLYRDQRMVRKNLELLNGTQVRIPDFKEQTYGLTLGGPIVQDTLFFFVSYEKVDEEKNPPSITNFPTADALTAIINQASALGIDPGQALESVDNVLTDDNLLLKLDWNINPDHRFSIRYNTVSSERPTFPGYGGRNLSFDSHWYDQEIENTSYIAQLFSSWSMDFSTEVAVSYSEYRSQPTFSRSLPMVLINDVPVQGTNQLGSVRFGTERSRHFNKLEVDTWTTEILGSLELNLRNTLTFGYQLEYNTIFNAFVQDWFGNYEFANVDAFLAASAGGWAGRYRYQFENPGVNPAAEFREANHALFVQNNWRVSDRLTVNYGLRIDVPDFGAKPDYNPLFEQTFGFANNSTYDGEYVVQPRVGFNWKANQEETLQIRGGFGLFYGRMPRVWMSNSYSNTGFNFSSIDVRNDATPPFSGDASNQPPFDPVARSQQVVALDPGFELPSSWKGTLAMDQRLGDYVLTLEAELSRVNKDVLFSNINRTVATVAPDGREILGPRVSNDFVNDIIKLSNTDKGESRTTMISLERPRQSDGWYWKLSYVSGYLREVQYGTSSVARSNWANRSILNQGEDVASRGELEIQHRMLGVLRKDFELAQGFRTTLSLLYDGRSGLPYSLVYGDDVNGDGVRGNDLIYVPHRGGDPIVKFATAADEETFFRMVDRRGLKEGEVVSAGSERYPFVHQFDISITQEFTLPGWRHKLEIGLDILNVGNLLNSDWGTIRGSNSYFVKRETAVRASYDQAAGQYTYSAANNDLAENRFNPHGGRGEPSSSRWAAMLSVRYKF